MSIKDQTFEGYKNQLINRLYGSVLCEREKNGEWRKALDAIIIEVMAMEGDSIDYWSLLGKLNMLKYLSYDYFRRTAFECMNLLGRIDNEQLR